jgi:hypothetical protein
MKVWNFESRLRVLKTSRVAEWQDGGAGRRWSQQDHLLAGDLEYIGDLLRMVSWADIWVLGRSRTFTLTFLGVYNSTAHSNVASTLLYRMCHILRPSSKNRQVVCTAPQLMLNSTNLASSSRIYPCSYSSHRCSPHCSRTTCPHSRKRQPS